MIRISSDIVYISFPNFNDDELLNNLGYVYTWSTWIGHPTHIKINELPEVVKKFGIIKKEIPIKSTSSEFIIPNSVVGESLIYDIKTMPKKEIIPINSYKEVQIEIKKN